MGLALFVPFFVRSFLCLILGLVSPAGSFFFSRVLVLVSVLGLGLFLLLFSLMLVFLSPRALKRFSTGARRSYNSPRSEK